MSTELPPGAERWNRAHRGAFLKGMRAHAAGEPRTSPYTDWRTARGAITWSRTFGRAWLDGWDWAARQAIATPKDDSTPA